MEINTDRQDGVLCVRASGRIDGASSTEFAVAIETATGADDRSAVLDFERVSYIGSAGLRAVLMTAKRLRKQDDAFSLYAPSNAVRQVFEISGFDKVVEIHPTRADALASLER